MACKIREVASWAQRPATSSNLLPFLYQTHTIQRRPLHASATPSQAEEGEKSIEEYFGNNHAKPFTIRRIDPKDKPRPRYSQDRASRSHRSPRKDDEEGADTMWMSKKDGQLPQARSYKTPDDDLPFEGLVDTNEDMSFTSPPSNPSPRHRDTTITDLERNAFARLFDKLSGRLPSSSSSSSSSTATSTASTPSPEDLDSLLSETSTDLSDADYLDLDRILDDDLRSSSPITRYPAALQPMAMRAHAELRRKQQTASNPTSSDPSSPQRNDPVTRAHMQEAQETVQQLKSARTDAEIWAILQAKVLDKVRAMDLDSSTTTTTTTTAKKPPHLSRTYPALVLLTLRLLLRRTAYTPLAFSLLPAITALGPSAHALLASAWLYNDLLAYTWTRTSSLRAVNVLLREMDAAGLNMGRKTYAALGRILKYREAALGGVYGEGVRAWEGMMGRGAEAEEVKGWMQRCWSGVEEEARERARRREWEEAVRREEEGDGDGDAGGAVVVVAGRASVVA